MRFSVLGPMHVRRGDAEVDVGARSLRLITALMLVRPGHPVTVPEITDLLWESDPPPDAVQAVHQQLRTLRQTLRLDRSGADLVLPADEDSLDLLAFRRLTELARHQVREGDPAGAVPLYVQALALWQGRCAADLAPTAALHPAFVAVNREGSDVAREAADAALAAGVEHTVLDQVRRAVERDPLDPVLRARHALLVTAESRVSHVSVSRVGVSRVSPMPVDAPPPTNPIRPAQLPAATRLFAGRQAELRTLSRWLPEDASVAIVAIDGMPGVGKSTLAVQWAHQAAPLFPDGQLFVNLRGFDARGAVIETDEALTGFLVALGAAHREIPFGADAKAALYRTMTAGRRMLVVLDNARDVEHVRPLVPGSSGSMVVVTSRNRLTALAVQEGAYLLTLDVPSPAEARESLRLRLGLDAHTADPADLDAIAAGCGRLPLAMAILAARTNPAEPLRTVVEQLRASDSTLDAFSGDDPTWDMRDVCSWSYRLLSPDAARLFRLLSVHPGPDFALPTMASLAGRGLRETTKLVAELTRTRLLTEHRRGRHVFHDLIRVYAMELAAATDSQADLRAATFRVADHLRQTAHIANVVLNPPMTLTPPPAPAPGVTPETVNGTAGAIAWFDAEFAVLESTVVTVSHEEFQPWTLVNMMLPYLQSLGMHEALGNLSRVALAVAVAEGDTLGEAHMYRMRAAAMGLGGVEPTYGLDELLRAESLFRQLGRELELGFVHNNLGWTYAVLRDPEQAMEQYRQALALFTGIGDRKGEAVARLGLGECLTALGREGEAMEQVELAVNSFQALGDKASWGSALTVLATILDHEGRHAESIRHYEHAIGIFTDVQYRVAQAEAGYALSGVHLRLGRPEVAESLLRQALPVADQAGQHALTRQIRERLDQLSPRDPENGRRKL